MSQKRNYKLKYKLINNAKINNNITHFIPKL